METVRADLGILKISDEGFSDVYHNQLNPWIEDHGKLPVIASGMIGSRQGWLEAPYVACPSGPEELAEQRVDYQKKLTEGQDEAVETDLLREQHKSMPIDVDRQSRVTFGGTKKS